jgi:hypothetical protein
VRGNLFVATAMLVTDSLWTIYEHGGTRAFRSAGFYRRLGGGVGGLALGMSVGGFVGVNATLLTAPALGGWAPAVGGVVGLASGAAAWAAGYAGGDFAARRILSAVNPDFLYAAEDESIAGARAAISSRLKSLQARPSTPG